MKTTLSRIAIAAVVGIVVSAVGAPVVNAACPGSAFIDAAGTPAAGQAVISNPNWCDQEGQGGCYDANGGPPVSQSMRGVFWGIGGADFGPVVGAGNDSGTFTGGFLATDFWLHKVSRSFYGALYHYAAFISQPNTNPPPDDTSPGGALTWSAAIVDGCGPSAPGLCSCVALTDTWNGQGYFALLSGAADSQFNTSMNFGGNIHLAPMPKPLITQSVRDIATGDVTVAVGAAGIPDTPAEGVYAGGGCAPCLAGFRVWGAVVPRGATPTAGQFVELPQACATPPCTTPQVNTPFTGQVSVRADCNAASDQDLFLALQLVGEGSGANPFKSTFLSGASGRVPCGSNLATPGRGKGDDPRPDRGRDRR